MTDLSAKMMIPTLHKSPSIRSQGILRGHSSKALTLTANSILQNKSQPVVAATPANALESSYDQENIVARASSVLTQSTNKKKVDTFLEELNNVWTDDNATKKDFVKQHRMSHQTNKTASYSSDVKANLSLVVTNTSSNARRATNKALLESEELLTETSPRKDRKQIDLQLEREKAMERVRSRRKEVDSLRQRQEDAQQIKALALREKRESLQKQKDRHRAEVYAINQLMKQYHHEEMTAFIHASRQEEEHQRENQENYGHGFMHHQDNSLGVLKV